MVKALQVLQDLKVQEDFLAHPVKMEEMALMGFLVTKGRWGHQVGLGYQDCLVQRVHQAYQA